MLPRVVALLLVLACSGCGEPTGAPARTTRTTSATPSGATAAEAAASWQARVPPGTRQVVRTISSTRFCRFPRCTVTQAWQKRGDGWALVRELPSTIGARGWGKTRKDDDRTPVGIYAIKVTFSTTEENPGRMPWRRRLPTSNVTDADGPTYNTWLEEPERTDGDRPAMRYGFVVDYNFVRLEPGVGPAPKQGAGSGIFFHTTRPGKPWEASDGCVRVSRPRDMRWLLEWLQPEHVPRVVLNS